MADNDIAALLGGLSFPVDGEEEGESFKLFPELPTELRLKIFEHALPSLTVLRLTAHILVSDPTFGFYVTFFMAAEKKATLLTVDPPRTRQGTRLRMGEKRVTALLQVCQESRALYLENFPIALPFDVRGLGRLYMSPKEVLHLENFAELIHNDLFQQALKESYRLQSWWENIEILAIPITCFILGAKGNEWPYVPALCQRMPALKELKGVMWDRFQDVIDNGNAEGMFTVKDAMKSQLSNAEYALSKFRDEHDPSFAVPRMELMF